MLARPKREAEDKDTVNQPVRPQLGAATHQALASLLGRAAPRFILGKQKEKKEVREGDPEPWRKVRGFLDG